MIRVSILDDQYIVLNGIQQMLADNTIVQLTGMYRSKAELEEGLKVEEPDVLLLDIRMPGEDGVSIAEWLSEQWPEIKILALTNFDTTQYVTKMMQAGVKGYLLKNTDLNTLVDAIRCVYQDEQYIEPGLKEQIVSESLQLKKQKGHIPSLTRREKEILRLIVREHASSKEIADKLFLSLRTVESHRYHLFQKLDVKNVTGLVAKALEMGLLLG
ncbi:response regulator [Taibaiella koreensis]|uniref:response regulator n=1 Tax=Taibaiella koreensis TaxID=1268548 RepID=UPI000E59BCE8|nr:response regulator transcription factor [Taibaiella koreensis]